MKRNITFQQFEDELPRYSKIRLTAYDVGRPLFVEAEFFKAEVLTRSLPAQSILLTGNGTKACLHCIKRVTRTDDSAGVKYCVSCWDYMDGQLSFTLLAS